MCTDLILIVLGLTALVIFINFIVNRSSKIKAKKEADSNLSRGEMNGSTMRNSAMAEVTRRQAAVGRSTRTKGSKGMGAHDIDDAIDDIEDVLVAGAMIAEDLGDDVYSEDYSDEPYVEPIRETYTPPVRESEPYTTLKQSEPEPESDWSTGNSDSWDSGGDDGGDDD